VGWWVAGRCLWGMLVVMVWGGTLWAQGIRFAPLPLERRETVEAQFQPLAGYLFQQLGVPVTLVLLSDYAMVLEYFRQGRVDLAYLGPLPYVQLRRSFAQAHPLVMFREPSGSASYTCAVVGMLGEVQGLDDLEDRHIALTQPLSTCGFFATDLMLRRHGSALARNSFFYAGSHTDALLAVARGSAHLAGAKATIAWKFQKLGLTILDESEPLPGFALVANGNTLSQEQRQAIVQAMMAADQRLREGADLGWGEPIRYGCVPAADEDYQRVRQLLEEGGQQQRGGL
jgi:phosphonate transport system substrate-binding protein